MGYHVYGAMAVACGASDVDVPWACECRLLVFQLFYFSITVIPKWQI